MTKMTTRRLATLVDAVAQYAEHKEALAIDASNVSDPAAAEHHKRDGRAAYSALAAVLERFPEQAADLAALAEKEQEKEA